MGATVSHKNQNGSSDSRGEPGSHSASPAKPLLRWAGSKRLVLLELRKLIPEENYQYVEPFCGSAALFFSLRPAKTYLADINRDLINFYEHCRAAPDAVFNEASDLTRSSETYSLIRNQIVEEPFGARRAAYFYYLNRNCFNGLYRTNLKGHFNVPYSPSRTGRMPHKADFQRSSLALRDVILRNTDFAETIRETLAPNVFYFLDPPYAVARRKPFIEYNSEGFSRRDLARLISSLYAIDQTGAKFALTYDNALADEFPVEKGWRKSELSVRRNISGFAGARKNAIEMVLTNFETAPQCSTF